MTELKIQHILTLAYLLAKGARHNFVKVTTSNVGKSIGKSQQSASKHLLDLEDRQFIERTIDGRNISIKITSKGYSEMIKLLSVLQQSMDFQPSDVILKGQLVSGMGEGAYYISLQGYTEQFRSKIGYVPYPGTLNVRLDRNADRDAIKQLETLEGITIDGFADGRRTFGWVKCFSCMVNDSIKCHLIIPERTHHDDSIVELISDVCIRDTCNIKDGSNVFINMQIDI